MINGRVQVWTTGTDCLKALWDLTYHAWTGVTLHGPFHRLTQHYIHAGI